ncbi:MAG: hypothetical protein WCP73_02535, partial [Eubacteriales bacterium]
MKFGKRPRLWLIVFAAILCVYALLGGCQAIRDSSVVFESTQNSSGGHDLGSGVNLKDITVSSDGKVTVITMYFIHGSRNSTVAETKLNAVPAYSATLLPVPQRLCIKLAVDYWDYQKNDDWYRNSLICGSFKTAASDDNHLSMYFQLNGDVSTSFRESADRLIITLTPKNNQSNQQYYVGLNAFEEFEQNLIPSDLGFTPTLCSDSSNVMLISEPLASQSDADALAAKVNKEIAGVAATKKPYTFTLGAGSLPTYNATIDMEEVNKKQVLQVDGKGQSLPVLVQNGRYLCTSPDGSILYARSYSSSAIADSPSNQNERLWVLGQNNKKTELGLPNFSNVEQSAYSPDGKYLAILDTSAHAKVLYVYIPETKELKNLGEEGFGNVTASFTWDTSKDIIYAMTGQSNMQLLSYNLDKPAGSRIARVGEISGTESTVASDGENIYYADPSGGPYGQVYSVSIITGLRSPVAPGISFKLSPDGNFMAVLTPSDTSNQEMFDLNMVNLSSDAYQTVMKSIYVEDYEFSLDSSELFYT